MTDSKVTTLDDSAALADEAVSSTGKTKTVVAAKAAKGANHDSALSGKKRTVTIHPTNDEGGSDAVFLAINGYAYQIPRGIPVEVPDEVVQVLKNAKQELMSFGKGGEVTTRETQRFPFSVE
jgi:formylmethanofuran dehydrogenase subunit B